MKLTAFAFWKATCTVSKWTLRKTLLYILVAKSLLATIIVRSLSNAPSIEVNSGKSELTVIVWLRPSSTPLKMLTLAVLASSSMSADRVKVESGLL